MSFYLSTEGVTPVRIDRLPHRPRHAVRRIPRPAVVEAELTYEDFIHLRTIPIRPPVPAETHRRQAPAFARQQLA